MYLRFFLILICSNSLTINGEFIVLQPSSASVKEKFLTFNIATDVVPQHYHITIDLDAQLDFQYFNGTTQIRFLSRIDTNVLVFHFNKSSLNEIFTIQLTCNNVDNHPVNINFNRATQFWLNGDSVIGLELDDENDLILQKNISYDLSVEYKVKFSDDVTTGFYKTCVPNGVTDKSCYVTTHFEAIHFRETVPSFDVIGLKSKFNIEIIHNSELMAMSNMPGNITQRTDHLVTTRFQETPLMSTYIVAFTVGKFKTFPVENQSNISMNIYVHHPVVAGITTLQTCHGRLLQAMENYLNISYSLPKLDVLVTRTSANDLRGMENWGLISLDETTVLENNLIPSLIQHENTIEVMSHEIVHQFFGNLVTMQNISYLWLNEGFTTYLSYRILAEIFPKENFLERVFLRDTAVAQWAESALPITVLNDFQLDAKPNRKIYVYSKGSVIVNVLMHVLGGQTFQSAMQMYIKKFSYGHVTPENLIDVIEEVNNVNQAIPHDINVREFINSWLTQNRFPIFTVTRNYATGDVVISQKSFKSIKSEPDQTWWIPFNYATKSKPNFWNTLPDGWLINGSMTLPLNLSADDWIIFNKQGSGYYVVQYDEENWRLITDAMTGDNFDAFPPIERARTISDAHYLSDVVKDTTNISKFYDLLMILQKDRSHVTWSVIDRILKIYLTPAMERHMKQNHLNYFKPAYDQMGFEHFHDETHQKRLTKLMVTNWACHFKYDKCLNDMNKKSEEYLESFNSTAPLILDNSIVRYLFQYGFVRDAAYEQISMCVHNSSNALLKEIFYSDLGVHSARPIFQLHYMLTMYNLTLSAQYKRPAITFEPAQLAKLNEFTMFGLCLRSNCYNYTANIPVLEERNLVIETLVARVIRTVENNNGRELFRVYQLVNDVKVTYNVNV